jgi:hypothetical protein
MRYTLAIIPLALATGLFLAGCGSDTTGPGNRAPEVTSLTADPDTVDPAGICTLTCSTADPDGDDLTYTWDGGEGTITGVGATVTWIGPIEAGTYQVSVTVDDGKGKSDSDSVLVEVRGGTLLVQTHTEVLAVAMSGDYFSFRPSYSKIEVVGTRIFLGAESVYETDHSGNVINQISRPPEGPSGVTDFAVLPDAGLAFMENWGDTITFVTSGGAFIENVVMPEASEINQGLSGVVVGNRLIISETGNHKLVQVDLTTRHASIFKDLSHLERWLGDIDYDNGVYYLTQYDNLYEFTEDGEEEVLFSVPDGFMLYLAVVGKYAYVTDRVAGNIYRVDVFTGEGQVLVEGLDDPKDIEYLPVALEAP